MGFVTVTAEQARESRYHGIDGWLMVFYVWAALSAMSAAATALALFRFEMFDVEQFQILAAARAISLLPFLILTPMKHRLMPIAAIAGEWINTAIASVLAPSVWISMFEGMSRLMTTVAEQGAASPEFGPALNRFNDFAEQFVQLAVWQAVLVGIAMTVLFTWYLLASRRVNATFRHRLRSDEP